MRHAARWTARWRLLFTACLALTPFGAAAQLDTNTIRRTVIATGLVNPVDIVAAPGDGTRLFVVEQAGRIRILRDGIVVSSPFLDVSSKTTGGGERGLLGLAFHPNYAGNRRFFVFYTRTSDGALIIERYERTADQPEQADFASGRVLLAIPHASNSNHNGGKLAFGRDGYLYIGTGDGGGGNDPDNNGQNFGTLLGKMLRVDVNVEAPPYYAIPPSNPFAARTCTSLPAGCPEIWALGLRNPFRFSFDRLNGDMFIGDVGQGQREEVDFEAFGSPGGRNYGWRNFEGNICTPGIPSNPCPTPPANYAPPIFDYGRSFGGSITGGFRYRGSRIPPLSGAYVYADFLSGTLWGATESGGTWTPQQELLTSPGISSFGEDNAGELYITGYFNGTIYRLDPVDIDSDGLPDWWEITYFGSTTGGNAGADNDGDGASNLSEFLSGTDPLNAQSVPPTSPFIAPEITSANALVCVVGSPCALTVGMTGAPTPTLTRSGTLPPGVGYNAATRTFSGTATVAGIGTYTQSLVASNGIAPNAAQTLTIVVAASCGGFVDVPVSDPACTSVEWLRNRGVTIGCSATQYCPNDPVIRSSMALFLRRFAEAIGPVVNHHEATLTAPSIDTQPVVCSTAESVAVPYPRRIQGYFAASIDASGPLTVGVTLVASRNAGATWEPISQTRMRAQTSGAQWRSVSGQGVLLMNAGDAVRFGLLLNRDAGSAAVTTLRCQIGWIDSSRDGSATPRDVLPLAP
ncbi:MAG TPA: PQQ-dependent sugar dehydrogenase [Casimicrobiaceae bacterium]|nr:PQQ-dependent sugar dehydrogenase [Casimicrobiaceae bacterium]